MADRNVPVLVSVPFPPEIMEALMDEADRRGMALAAFTRGIVMDEILSEERGLDFSGVDLTMSWKYTPKKRAQELRNLLARTSGLENQSFDTDEGNGGLYIAEPSPTANIPQPTPTLPDRIPRKW